MLFAISAVTRKKGNFFAVMETNFNRLRSIMTTSPVFPFKIFVLFVIVLRKKLIYFYLYASSSSSLGPIPLSVIKGAAREFQSTVFKGNFVEV